MRVAMSLKQFQIHPSITLVERTKGGVCVCGFLPFLEQPSKILSQKNRTLELQCLPSVSTFRVN